MITVLNRREVLLTYNLQRLAEVRELLETNNVKYDYKVINRNSPSALSDARARTGTFGQNSEFMREYIIYVHKKEYDYARALLQGKF